MSLDSIELKERIYLPPLRDGVTVTEYLAQYVQREFPPSENGETAIFSIPRIFKKTGENQARLAEQTVFNRLKNINAAKTGGLWITFFHSACYAGQSFRNQRVGRLIIREHDFVVFAKYLGKFYIILMEVKSTNDQANDLLEKISDAKEIKNNKRSAQHQLRDHIEVLQRLLGADAGAKMIQKYIMWPFLSSYTMDSKQEVVKRWKEDENLHVFEDTLAGQEQFNEWFHDNILSTNGIAEEYFVRLLNRFILLSCGVFVDEINQGMMALLTQEQRKLLNSDVCAKIKKRPMVVHGAAGTGKTLLILKKLQQLHEDGQLDDDNRALYICYWPGLRCEIDLKLEIMGIKAYVDTARFFISINGFLENNRKAYRHVFMDEAEAICLALDKKIVNDTISGIYSRYHVANCTINNCKNAILEKEEEIFDVLESHESLETWGELWFLVDINQASIFLPKHSPNMLKNASVALNKVMRTTGYIFNVFKQFYSVPIPTLPKKILENMNIPNITIGHHISGPPVFWVDAKNNIGQEVASVVIDLCSTKGFKPNELCVLPFLVNERLTPDNVNKYIDESFAPNGYRPKGITDVECYLKEKQSNLFLIPWTLRVKGLEFKVVIMAIDGDDFDLNDPEDRKKAYITISRCTTMLIIVGNNNIVKTIDVNGNFQIYPFCMGFTEGVM